MSTKYALYAIFASEKIDLFARHFGLGALNLIAGSVAITSKVSEAMRPMWF